MVANVVRGRQSSPVPAQQPAVIGGSEGCARVTGKAGENGQHSGAERQLTLDKTVGSRVWRHTQCSSGRPALDLGWGSSSKTAPGSQSTGSLARRTPPHGDGSMYSQANVKPSVIVGTEKVLREADGPEESDSTKKSASRWKGDRPWVRPRVRTREAGKEPEDHKRQNSSDYRQQTSVPGNYLF